MTRAGESVKNGRFIVSGFGESSWRGHVDGTLFQPPSSPLAAVSRTRRVNGSSSSLGQRPNLCSGGFRLCRCPLRFGKGALGGTNIRRVWAFPGQNPERTRLHARTFAASKQDRTFEHVFPIQLACFQATPPRTLPRDPHEHTSEQARYPNKLRGPASCRRKKSFRAPARIS